MTLIQRLKRPSNRSKRLSKPNNIPVGQLASSTEEAKELINDDIQITGISGDKIAVVRSVVETRFDRLAEFMGTE